MKVAIVHDYIKEYGGAERVLEALHEIFPKAPVYTTVYLPDYLGPHKERFADWNIQTSFLQVLPLKAKLISPFRLLAPIAFKQFDFSEFDVVLTSATGAYFPNVLHKRGAKLICYCHTPPRYLYGYATAREWKKNPIFRFLGETANHFLRMVDYSASQNVDQFIANSQEVAGRIRKFYRKDAVVIYPPVDIENAKVKNEKSKAPHFAKASRDKQVKNKEYFLAGGRLARAKHIDLIVRVCTEQNLPLKVFGKAFAGYGEELQKIAGATVEFLGEVTDEEKFVLMSNARAYLFAAEDEDSGITPVEAMAAGTPVIAYRSGGVRETVVEGNPSTSSGQGTGLFFEELSVASLKAALKKFEGMKFDTNICMKRAEQFSNERFKKEIKELVRKVTS